MMRIPRLHLLLAAVAASLAMAGCGDSAPSHLGEPSTSQKVRSHLENLGHAVEDGSTAIKDGLEGLGENVQNAAASVGETVDSLKAPPAPSPQADGTQSSGAKVYEAPPRRQLP